METIIIITTIVFIVIFALLFAMICSNKYDNKDRSGIIILYTIVIVFAIILLSATISIIEGDNKQPKAIDVYRGMTELEITKTYLNDTIIQKCDSVVVFKPEFK